MPRINNPLNLAGIPLGAGGFNADLANFNFTEEITSTDNVCPVTIKRGDCIYWHPANAGEYINNYTGNFYINTEEVQFPEMGMALILVDMRDVPVCEEMPENINGWAYVVRQPWVFYYFNIYINNQPAGAISFSTLDSGYNVPMPSADYALISIAFNNYICGVNMLSSGGVQG